MQVSRTLLDLVSATSPARPLAVARIVVGAAALLKLVALATYASRLFSPGMLRVPYGWAPVLPAVVVWALVALCLAAAAAFLLGWRTRWAGAFLTFSIGALLLVDQQLYSNHLYLLGLTVLLLTLADSGATLSLDARDDRPRAQVPRWPVTLLKIQVTIVYGFAAVAKLNVEYLSGAALNSSLARQGVLAFPELLRTVEVLAPLAVITVMIEMVLALALWSARLRPAAFVLGMLLHLVIIVSMDPRLDLVVFSMVMFSMYLLFMDAAPKSRTVVWDDTCTFCGMWVRWFRRLDWLAVHQFVGSADDVVMQEHGIPRYEADQALQYVTQGDRRSGFDAVVRVLEALPVSFLWAPALRLPPARALGGRAYRAVAERRRCGAIRLNVQHDNN